MEKEDRREKIEKFEARNGKGKRKGRKKERKSEKAKIFDEKTFPSNGLLFPERHQSRSNRNGSLMGPIFWFDGNIFPPSKKCVRNVYLLPRR